MSQMEELIAELNGERDIENDEEIDNSSEVPRSFSISSDSEYFSASSNTSVVPTRNYPSGSGLERLSIENPIKKNITSSKLNILNLSISIDTESSVCEIKEAIRLLETSRDKLLKKLSDEVDTNSEKTKVFSVSEQRDVAGNRNESNVKLTGADAPGICTLGDELTSDEDEYERNHPGEGPKLSEYGRKIKKILISSTANNKASYVPVCKKPMILTKKADEDGKSSTSSGMSRDVSQKDIAKHIAEQKFFDGFFRLKIRNPKISSTTFEAFCEGIRKVLVCDLFAKKKIEDPWITMGVLVDKSSYLKTANGSNFMKWKFSDLHSSACVVIFVYGDCLKVYWKLQVGCAFAMRSPFFIESKGEQVSLKLTKCDQIIELGYCIDFGMCKGSRRDGTHCRNFVNLSKCDYCVMHAVSKLRNTTVKRNPFIQKSKKSPPKFVKNFKDCVANKMIPLRISSQNVKPLKTRNEISTNEVAKLQTLITTRAGGFGARNFIKHKGSTASVSNVQKSSDLNLKIFFNKQDDAQTRGTRTSFSSESTDKIHTPANVSSSTENRLNSIQNAVGMKRKRPSTTCTPSPVHAKAPRRSEIVASKPDDSRIFSLMEIEALISKKSLHENELEKADREKTNAYFDAMEQRDKLETYLTETMEIKNCDVVSCKTCEYTASHQSKLCAENGHAIKRHKATKRFFRCGECQRRTTCYTIIPVRPCEKCGGKSFKRVAMLDEKKVPSENKLKIRGEERKFVNS